MWLAEENIWLIMIIFCRDTEKLVYVFHLEKLVQKSLNIREFDILFFFTGDISFTGHSCACRRVQTKDL